jgi:DNA gyrase subunit A
LISELKEILENEDRLMEVIKEELEDIKNRYGDARRTIIEKDFEEINDEDMIPDEKVIVAITKDGYMKRNSLKLFKSQRRGGKGKTGMATKESDLVKDIFVASTKDYLLIFTNRGRCYWLKVFEVPQTLNLNAKGRAIVNLINLSYGEKVLSILPVKDFSEDKFVTMATRNGLVKKTALKAYSYPRATGIIAIKLDEGDQLVTARLTNGDNHLLLCTLKGQAIRFHEEQIRPTGRNSMGVTGIRLKQNDKVVTMEIINSEDPILTITENGFGKRSPLKEYVPQKRGGRGRFLAKVTPKTGNIVDAIQVSATSDLIISTDSGRIIRIAVSDVNISSRVTQGVKLVNIMPEKEKVVSVTVVKENDEDNKNEEEHGLFDAEE